jgi:CheY-like chemotaxis protein
MQDATRAPVAALVQDLFFSSKIGETLRHLGYRALVTGRVDEFEEQVRREQPGLALVDLGLRGVDWAAAIRRLRAAPELADLPIIAFGPHRDLELRERALEAGCTEVVANSKFVTDLPHLVERYAGARRDV